MSDEPNIPEDLKRLQKHFSEERGRLGEHHTEGVEKRKKAILKRPPNREKPNAEKIPDTQPIQRDVVPEDNPQELQDPD